MLDRITQIRQGVDFIPIHSGGDLFMDAQELLEIARAEPSIHKRRALIAQAQQNFHAAEATATEAGNHELALRIETMIPLAPMMVEFDRIGERPLADNERKRLERQLNPAAVRRQVALTAASTLATHDAMLLRSAPLRQERWMLRKQGLSVGDPQYDELAAHLKETDLQNQIPELTGLMHEQTYLALGLRSESIKTISTPAFFYDDVHGERQLRRDFTAHDYRSHNDADPVVQHVGVQIKASVQDGDRLRYHGSVCLISGNEDLANQSNAPAWRAAGRYDQFSTLRALIDQELGLPGTPEDAAVLATIYAKNQKKIEIVRKSGLDASRGQPRAIGKRALGLSA